MNPERLISELDLIRGLFDVMERAKKYPEFQPLCITAHMELMRITEEQSDAS